MAKINRPSPCLIMLCCLIVAIVLFFNSICSDAGDSLNDCRIMFLTEIYKIEEPGSLSDVPPGSESPLKSKSLLGDGRYL